jgi:hypothetical protein
MKLLDSNFITFLYSANVAIFDGEHAYKTLRKRIQSGNDAT